MARTHPNRCTVCFRTRHFCQHTFPQGAFCEIEYQQPFSHRHTTTHWQEVHTNEIVEFIRAESLRMQMDLAIFGRAEVPSPEEARRRFEVRVGNKAVGWVSSWEPKEGKTFADLHEIRPGTYFTDGKVELRFPVKKVMGDGVANLKAVEKLDLPHQGSFSMGASYSPPVSVGADKGARLPPEKVDEFTEKLVKAVEDTYGLDRSWFMGVPAAPKPDLEAIKALVKKAPAPAHVLDFGESHEWADDVMNEFRAGDKHVGVVQKPHMVDMDMLRGTSKK
jgi:hypothetical protein